MEPKEEGEHGDVVRDRSEQSREERGEVLRNSQRKETGKGGSDIGIAASKI